MLERILLNVMTNVTKASASKSTIKIEFVFTLNPSPWVVQGMGLDQQRLIQNQAKRLEFSYLITRI